MTVNITACGPGGHREHKHFYRAGLDPFAMRTLVEAMAPLLPEYGAFTPADEDDWLFHGVSVFDTHPDIYNATIATLRASGSVGVKAAMEKIGDELLTELGRQGQLVQLSVNPWRKDGETLFSVTMSTDGNALDEPTREACLSRAQALYADYGLSEPDGQDAHVLPAAQVLKAAEGRRTNDLVKIASWAIKTFGPEATVACH